MIISFSFVPTQRERTLVVKDLYNYELKGYLNCNIVLYHCITSCEGSELKGYLNCNIVLYRCITSCEGST